MSDDSNQYDTLNQSYCYCYPAQFVLLGEGEVVYEPSPSVQPHHTTSEVYELGGIYITLNPDVFRFTFVITAVVRLNAARSLKDMSTKHNSTSILPQGLGLQHQGSQTFFFRQKIVLVAV